MICKIKSKSLPPSQCLLICRRNRVLKICVEPKPLIVPYFAHNSVDMQHELLKKKKAYKGGIIEKRRKEPKKSQVIERKELPFSVKFRSNGG